MLTFSSNIRTMIATAAVVAAGAFALPAIASATPTATGCSPADNPQGYCEFVGGTGADVSIPTGGKTQFEINTGGPGTGGGAIVACDHSGATAVTDGSDTITTQLTFEDCLANGTLATVVTCGSVDITIDSVLATGVADGRLGLTFEACEINVLNGACVIKTSNNNLGQDIGLGVTGADASGPGAQLTVPVASNTDALSFKATGAGCVLASVPATGTATFSDVPNSGTITYEEVGSDLHIDTLP